VHSNPTNPQPYNPHLQNDHLRRLELACSRVEAVAPELSLMEVEHGKALNRLEALVAQYQQQLSQVCRGGGKESLLHLILTSLPHQLQGKTLPVSLMAKQQYANRRHPATVGPEYASNLLILTRQMNDK